MRLLVVLGTRPEAIKLAPVLAEAHRRPGVDIRLCVTGQHREMLHPFLDLFDLRPDHALDLMRPDQAPADLAARSLAALADLLRREPPDRVVVQGDTTTTWTAAMAAFLSRVPVAHVEAGLRSGDPHHPFPEEVHRRIVTQIADLHLAPTTWARDNLLNEGVPSDRIVVTGNPAIDALLAVKDRIERDPPDDVRAIAAWHSAQVSDRPMVLITGHRRESFGAGIDEICAAIAELADTYADHHWVYPVHLNPRVQQPVRAILSDRPNVHLLPPQPYAAFVWLMTRCRWILTDSGGIQEEAPTLGKPVLLMRKTTERPEGVRAGVVTLVGTDRAGIVAAARERIASANESTPGGNPFGDGYAAPRILDAILAPDPPSEIS
jgi:UDP-N-acetylglucosamine 2-epimerase (non-hydrolysing)